ESRMLNVMLLLEHALERCLDLFHIVDVAALDHHVGFKCLVVLVELPSVQMMNLLHARHRLHLCNQFIEIKTWRRCLHQNADRFADHCEALIEDVGGNGQGGDQVGDVQVVQQDQ